MENHRITMDTDRIKMIVDWPIPKSLKDMQSFLGFTNVY